MKVNFIHKIQCFCSVQLENRTDLETKNNRKTYKNINGNAFYVRTTHVINLPIQKQKTQQQQQNNNNNYSNGKSNTQQKSKSARGQCQSQSSNNEKRTLPRVSLSPNCSSSSAQSNFVVCHEECTAHETNLKPDLNRHIIYQ